MVCLIPNVIFIYSFVIHFQKTDLGFENPAFSAGDEEANLDDMSLDDYKDEGSIQLVIQVLAGMCDGQFRPLQVTSHPGASGHVRRPIPAASGN